MPFAAAIGRMVIDLLYFGLPRMPALGEEVYAKNLELQPDGGATAIITALTRLGADSRLGTFLSDDLLSLFAKKMLESNNIRYKNFFSGSGSPVVVTSVATFDEDRSFITYAPDKVNHECTDEDVYGFYSGAGVCTMVPGHDDVFRKLRQEGSRIVYDVIWSYDLDIGNLKHTLKNVDVFTPNQKEALQMTGKTEVEEALRDISRYVEHVVIKLGKNGCVTCFNGKVLHMPALEVFDTVDTTGAGDNFLAGIMFGLMNNWDIENCMKLGNILGGSSTTELGCSKAHLSIEKALEYMKLY